MWILVFLVQGISIFLLILKIIRLKQSVREIRQQVTKKLAEDTNTPIGISSGDRDIRFLAKDLNMQLKTLREQRLRYEEGDRELKEAVTNISHDLRTPLTAICGYLDLLEKEPLSSASSRYLQIICERTDAIRGLMDELMQYSVAVSQELKQKDTILNDVLEESVSAYYAALLERHISPEIHICETSVHRMLCRNALTRIFSNILSNAVKYSDGDLEISLTEDGVVSFSNHASHLDEISVGKLFDRFYTVETADRSTGLGLSIAGALTEQMGGCIKGKIQEGILTIQVYFEGSDSAHPSP